MILSKMYLPCEGVLVHWLNVGQVCDGEEQNRGLNGNWFVTQTSLVNFHLSLFSNGLLRGELVFNDHGNTMYCML